MPKAKAKKGATESVAVAWENPLIPNKKLRALYVAMMELRLLEEHIANQRPRSKFVQTANRGEEGCRVSTTVDLKSSDLTSEWSNGVATDFLRGAKLTHLVDRVRAPGKPAATERKTLGQLPVLAIPVDRLHLAMGAALALKTARKSALLVAYASCDEMKLAEWKPLLRFAAEQVLPVIFVVLPAPPETRSGTRPANKPGQLSLASTKCGVPGIPVDAADPVALYRVAQESMLRARSVGGPVLMECIPFRPVGNKAVPGDPIATMKEFLLQRKIADEAWLEGVESRFSARLKASLSQR